MMELESHKEGTTGNGSPILRRVTTFLYRLLVGLLSHVVYVRFTFLPYAVARRGAQQPLESLSRFITDKQVIFSLLTPNR